MKRELLRLAHRLISILNSIRDGIQSINDQRRSDAENNKPPCHANTQIEINLPPAVSEHYESEKRDVPKYIRRDRIRLIVEFLTLASAIGVAIFAFRSFGEVHNQAVAAQAQVAIMQQQFAANTRPWIGIVSAPQNVSFGIIGGNGNPLDVSIQFDLMLHNYGNSPALVPALLRFRLGTLTKSEPRYWMTNLNEDLCELTESRII